MKFEPTSKNDIRNKARAKSFEWREFSPLSSKLSGAFIKSAANQFAFIKCAAKLLRNHHAFALLIRFGTGVVLRNIQIRPYQADLQGEEGINNNYLLRR